MPQSSRHFAVIELPGIGATVTIEAIGDDGTVFDAEELIGGN